MDQNPISHVDSIRKESPVSAVSALVAETVTILVSLAVLIKVFAFLIKSLTTAVNALRELELATINWQQVRQRRRRQQQKRHKNSRP